MIRALLAVAIAVFLHAVPAEAQDRVTLGYGRLFDNDLIGDGEDRWRTGSYVFSLVRGQEWRGTRPGLGELLEYRLRAEIIAPRNLVSPPPGDRRYAGIASVGLHTHFALAGMEASLGADLVFTGPQTGLGEFQRQFHEVFDLSVPQVLGNQIPNGLHPTLLAELGRSFALGDRVTVRPFVEAQAGVETLLRAGGDMVLGGFGQGALMLRDPVTGQPYTGIAGPVPRGFSLTLGADAARVFDSAYLPDGGAAVLSDSRTRLRAGVNWAGERSEVFYGLTRLGREYEGQSEAQVVGSLRLRIWF